MENALTPRWMQEEHALLQQSTRKFFESELVPNIDQWRSNGVADRDFWYKAADVGLLGASVPERFGGFDGTYAHEAVIAFEIAKTGDTAWSWAVHSICLHYILTFGTEEQKKRWLPGMVSGDIVPAVAMSEPGAGSDLQAIKTSAKKVDGHYIINGSKTFISNGQCADIVIVVAKTSRDKGAKGISLIVVETNEAEGFTRGRNLKKLGMNGQDTSELFFDSVRVPECNLIGEVEGEGFKQLMQQLPWERLMIAISAVGMSNLILDETLTYVKERNAFGQRVMDFQNTRFKLAECKTKIEVSRAYVDECIERLVDGNLDAESASMAKWWGAQMQCDIADECLQLHGGYGYMMEYPVARLYADSRVQKIYGGTNEIMKEVIARSLDD